MAIVVALAATTGCSEDGDTQESLVVQADDCRIVEFVADDLTWHGAPAPQSWAEREVSGTLEVTSSNQATFVPDDGGESLDVRVIDPDGFRSLACYSLTE